MLDRVIETPCYNWHELKTSLQLEKAICIGKYRDPLHSQGHFSDYLSGVQPFVAMRALKDSHLVLWDSNALIGYCSYNDALNVSFHVFDDLMQDAAVMNMESWSGNNGFILRRSKSGCDVTYYFSLLHSHALTGELSVSPCFYFIENPNFYLSSEAQASIGDLLKAEPICLKVRENQILCFDKFHYQMQYNPDFSFVRVCNA